MIVAAIVLSAAAIDGASQALHAQSPFGGSRSPVDPQMTGIIGWLLTKQAEFYREISSTIKAAKTDGSAVWSLLAISFLYGVFHAAGPGHGKAVISSYLVANKETARRGILLSFVSALSQSLVAVLMVGIGAWLLNATAKSMCGAERIIEIASYGLIAVLGARLTWTKGRGLIRTLGNSQAHDHGGHVHDEHCGHSHGPQPGDLSGPEGWRRGLGAAVTVGLRPCSGAILVLVFAFAQGLFWAGIAATFVMGLGTAITVATIAALSVYAKDVAVRLMKKRAGGAALLSRSLEFAAAGLVLLFGLGLSFGLIAAERVTCF